jgi:hypothetical protein
MSPKWGRVNLNKSYRRVQMSMKRSGGHVPGGGIHSRQRVDVPVRVGKPATGHNEGRVGQYGASLDPKAVEERFKPMPHGGDIPLGNAVAQSTVCGVGGSRTISKSGSQGVHGPTVGENKPTSNELFPGWPSQGRPKA